MLYLSLFARAFVQVGLVALNVRAIAAGKVTWAVLGGMAISLVWWYNAHSAAHVPGIGAAIVYALGAGAGTLFGVLIGKRKADKNV